MKNKHTFKAVIQNAGGGGAFVEVPFDVEEALGSKRPRIRADIEGAAYRGILTRMGGERHILIVLKSIREQIGKSFGDEIRVTVELDAEPRVVEIPDELKKAFKGEKEAKAFFEKLPYSHQREYVGYITEAKKPETRERRAARTVAMLKKGKKERQPVV
ncbi:MAG: hypothetical protein DPW18_07020 [Chloroflexi bacterium]|nr:hypothetical protein [Chloroflexota bacterium]MDL1942310.1 DUF1905 domain-containing protein [Chloroflexi bacterium CFX2]